MQAGLTKGLIAAAPAVTAIAASVAEPAVGVDLRAANWPADLGRLVADFRSRYPRSRSAADVASIGEPAKRAQRAVQSKDVNAEESLTAIIEAEERPQDQAAAAQMRQSSVPASSRGACGWRRCPSAMSARGTAAH
jgi:hypothetical protein